MDRDDRVENHDHNKYEQPQSEVVEERVVQVLQPSLLNRVEAEAIILLAAVIPILVGDKGNSGSLVAIDGPYS